MKQVLQSRSALTVVRDVPAPPCPPGGLLVRNAFSVISSGTERARVELSGKSLLGKARERPDLVREVFNRARNEGVRQTSATVRRRLEEETPVGYSSAGVVIAVGAEVAGFSPGDSVACAGGGHANHAEIVSVPANLCTRVPDGVSLQTAAFACIGAIAMHSVRLAEVQLGERVAVIGCGMVGRIAIRLLRCAGAEVFAVDVDRSRVEAAADGTSVRGFVVEESTAQRIEAATGGVGVDAVLVTAAASSNDPLLLAASVARDRGTVVLVGAVPIELPRAPLYDKELRFRVSRSYGPGRYDSRYEEKGLDYPIAYVRWTEQRNMQSVLDLLADRRLELDDLIDSIVPVEEAAEAYLRLTGEGGDALRGAIVLSYGEAVQEQPLPPGSGGVAPGSPSLGTDGGMRAGLGRNADVRIGLIGPGTFASKIIVPQLQAAGAKLELVGGSAGPSAEAAIRQMGFNRVAESATAVIEDPLVDAIVISTRHASHAALARQALEAGKHVFCEKPLAIDLEQLDGVLGAAQRYPGILSVGFNRRFAPMLVRLREHIADQGPVTASYRVSAGRVEAAHWTHDLDEGGGRALGEGCHFLDCLAFVTSSPIVEVHAIAHGAPELALQARDNLVISLRFANESVGVVTYVSDGASSLPKERLEAFSGARTAVLDDYRRLELLGPGAAKPWQERVQDKGHGQELRAWLDGTRRGEPPVALADVRNVSLATLAIASSLSAGRPVIVS